MDDPHPDIIKLLQSANIVYDQDVASTNVTTWTVPAGMSWIVFLGSILNATRVASCNLGINDGTSMTLRTGVAEGDNVVDGFILPLKAGWTITLTDGNFVAADVMKKQIAYWEIAQT